MTTSIFTQITRHAHTIEQLETLLNTPGAADFECSFWGITPEQWRAEIEAMIAAKREAQDAHAAMAAGLIGRMSAEGQ